MFHDADRDRIARAVAQAEALSDGEIVTVVAAQSDEYGDMPLYAALLLMLFGAGLVAAFPAPLLHAIERVAGGWGGPATLGEFVCALIVLLAILFVIGRALFAQPSVRSTLTPAATKTRRVRARALLLFRLAAENRTRARTGVLLYLSLAERRAEIVADASIAARVTPETWGAAMAALVDAVRDGRPGDGMVAAIGQIGAVLAAHFPRSADDANELPDRLILL